MDKDAANKIIILSACGRSLKTSYEVSHDFRSGSLTRLHISESSRVRLELAQGSIDAVPQKGRIIQETTAKGRDPLFYKNYKVSKESKRKQDIYVWEPHFFPWFDHYPEPGHTLSVPDRFVLDEKEKQIKALGASDISLVWRRWKIKENFLDDPEKFDEEYPSDDESCFLGGYSIVPRKYLLLLERWAVPPVKQGHLFPKDKWMEFREDERGFLSIWELPKIGEQYTIGADPSEGVGADRCAAYVRCRSNGKYVARIWGQLYPEELAEQLYMLALFYNRAFICFELNNHGWVVKDRLVQKAYTNLYHRRELNDISGNWQVSVGFKTDYSSKERVAMNWVSRLREGKIRPFDEELVTELSTFQRDENGRLNGTEGCHDDLVMAAFLTEEMDVALGPFIPNDEEDYIPVKLDSITGYPL